MNAADLAHCSDTRSRSSPLPSPGPPPLPDPTHANNQPPTTPAVVLLRKKKVLSLPNSILIRHNDAVAGLQREELLTSFRLSSRQHAFALLSQQWALAWCAALL